MIPIQYWLMMPTDQFGVDGHYLDGGRAQCGDGKVGGTGVALNVGAGVLVSCDHVGNNICSWTIWEVTFFIEIMVDKYDRVKEGFKR